MSIPHIIHSSTPRFTILLHGIGILIFLAAVLGCYILQASRKDSPHLNKVVHPYDWTYTTDYKGETMNVTCSIIFESFIFEIYLEVFPPRKSFPSLGSRVSTRPFNRLWKAQDPGEDSLLWRGWLPLKFKAPDVIILICRLSCMKMSWTTMGVQSSVSRCELCLQVRMEITS